jgi:hypothetical protein
MGHPEGMGSVREALAGDLEAVEKQAGAVDIELVGGETVDDLVEGVLECVGGGGEGDVEATAGAAGVGVLHWLAVGVVVVAVVLAAQGGGAAAVGVGEDVLAGGVGVVRGHVGVPLGSGERVRWWRPGGLPPDTFWAKVWMR